MPPRSSSHLPRRTAPQRRAVLLLLLLLRVRMREREEERREVQKQEAFAQALELKGGFLASGFR